MLAPHAPERNHAVLTQPAGISAICNASSVPVPTTAQRPALGPFGLTPSTIPQGTALRGERCCGLRLASRRPRAARPARLVLLLHIATALEIYTHAVGQTGHESGACASKRRGIRIVLLGGNNCPSRRGGVPRSGCRQSCPWSGYRFSSSCQQACKASGRRDDSSTGSTRTTWPAG
jgi:hypothetical protein